MEIVIDNRYRWAIGLAWFTIVYNILEGLVSTYFGFEDEALSLFGFGVDSFIEMISSVGILVMVKRIINHPDTEKSTFEKTALRITGYCLYALTALLLITAIISIKEKHQPESTLMGLLIASISVGIMWLLIKKKEEIGRSINSDAMIADANCAKVCMYMSLVLMSASLINFLFPMPFIDAAGAIGIAWFSYTEGKESLQKAKGLDTCSCEGHCH